MNVTPITKEAQRAELHKTIWRIANDLRGSVDGWDFKTYVLGMLFYRFISENLTAYLNEQEREAGNPDFDYAASQRRGGRVRSQGDGRREGLLHPARASCSPTSASERADDENLNETLRAVFRNIEGSAVGTDSEDDLKGLFDDLDVNSAQARHHRGEAQREARQAARRHRRPRTSATSTTTPSTRSATPTST